MTKFLQNAGRYRHPIVVQKQDSVRNDYGERVDTWGDFIKTRAAVLPVSGRQLLAAQSIQSEVTHQVHMRYLPNITPDMRIQFGSRYFIILSVINFQEMDKELQLLCKELIA